MFYLSVVAKLHNDLLYYTREIKHIRTCDIRLHILFASRGGIIIYLDMYDMVKESYRAMGKLDLVRF